MTAPERFKKWRKEQRLLLYQVAEATALSVVQISALECGKIMLRDIPQGAQDLGAIVPADIVDALYAHEIPVCSHGDKFLSYLLVEPHERSGFYDVCCDCGDVDWGSGPRPRP